jgi:hypothetical protein
VNVTGQSAFFWTAAAGDMPTLLGAVGTARFVGGDRMFVASDHSETQTAATTYGSGAGAASFTSGQVLSVSRAGSTPPVAADLAAGATATVSSSGALTLETSFPVYHYGMNYMNTGSTTSTAISISSGAAKVSWLDTCQLYLNSAVAGARIGGGSAAAIILYNTTVRFGSTSQGIGNSASGNEIIWLNTPSSIAGATIPTTLFLPITQECLFTVRGVDLSAITGTLMTNNSGSKLLLDSCKIASGVTRLITTTPNQTRDLVELVNCYDGTNFISESYQTPGAVTTEFTITLSGGATDNVGTFSHKMVSNTNVDKYVNPLNGFWMDVNYAPTGSSKTATVEIISSAALNNDEISLILEYQGTASSSVASFVTSLPATVLTTASAVTTSTATWNSSPATPVKQHLQVTFTPRTAGRVRGQVRLGKVSTTVWYNPQVTIA